MNNIFRIRNMRYPAKLLGFLILFLLCHTRAWQNAEISKYSEYLQQMKVAAENMMSLHDALLRTKTHVYAIATRDQVRQNHMRDFMTSVLHLSFDNASSTEVNDRDSTPHFADLVQAVELSASAPLHEFVISGVLSRDYNASWRHQRVNPGRLACQLSLVRALELFLRSSHHSALVLEGGRCSHVIQSWRTCHVVASPHLFMTSRYKLVLPPTHSYCYCIGTSR